MKNHAAIFASLLQNEDPPYLFWKSPEGEIWIAAGAAMRFAPPQPSAWRSWLHEGAFAASSSADLPRFALLGFIPDASVHGDWTGFPYAELIEPAVGYHFADGKERFIGIEADRIPDAAAPEPAHDFIEQTQIRIDEWNADAYRDIVSKGLEMLHREEVDKIVLARNIAIDLHPAFDPLRAFRSLQHQPHSFSILYSPDGERYFLSATPERLGRIRNGRFSTMALAGTLAGSAGSDRESLLENAKERAEHAYVVEMIRNEAASFCNESIVDTVRVLNLPHVTHILTQIEGALAPGRGMGDVLAALHPTPAVAGTPRIAAYDRIAQLEQFSRGLYAGCIGWVDANGNGDAAVAIRSAVVSGAKATAFAGAGIVIGSDPAEEEHETRAKLQTALDILGS